jgi:hypothetical protein
MKSSQEKEIKNIYLADAGWHMIKCKNKQSLASKNKKKHKDAKRNQEYMTLHTTIISCQKLTKQKWGLYIINVLSCHLHLFYSAI